MNWERPRKYGIDEIFWNKHRDNPFQWSEVIQSFHKDKTEDDAACGNGIHGRDLHRHSVSRKDIMWWERNLKETKRDGLFIRDFKIYPFPEASISDGHQKGKNCQLKVPFVQVPSNVTICNTFMRLDNLFLLKLFSFFLFSSGKSVICTCIVTDSLFASWIGNVKCRRVDQEWASLENSKEITSIRNETSVVYT